jgi:hypothetical protein
MFEGKRGFDLILGGKPGWETVCNISPNFLNESVRAVPAFDSKFEMFSF